MCLTCTCWKLERRYLQSFKIGARSWPSGIEAFSMLRTTSQSHSTIKRWIFNDLEISSPSLMAQHSAIRLLVRLSFRIDPLIQVPRWFLIRVPHLPRPGLGEQDPSEFSLSHPLGGGAHPMRAWLLGRGSGERLGPIATNSAARFKAWMWGNFQALMGSNYCSRVHNKRKQEWRSKT